MGDGLYPNRRFLTTYGAASNSRRESDKIHGKMKRVPDERPTPDYAKPPAKDHRLIRGLAAVLGLALGMFAVPMLWIGLEGLVEVLRRPPPRIDLPGDMFGVAMFILIGLFCGFVSVRWIRAGLRS